MLITPKTKRLRLDWKELADSRELLYFLVWRDLKVRYRQTLLGVAWVILQPLVTVAVYSLIFGSFIRFQVDDPYHLFVLVGLLPWLYFSNAVSDSGNCFVVNQNLITKIYFPRILIPASRIIALTSDFFIYGSIVFLAVICYDSSFGYRFLLLPFIVALTFVFAFSVSLLFASLNVRFRDFNFVIPFLVQIWMFCSPIIYPLNILPENFQALLKFNPMVGIVHSYRYVFLGQNFDFSGLIYSVFFICATLFLAFYYFNIAEREFADIF